MVDARVGKPFVLFVSSIFLLNTSCTSYYLIDAEPHSVMENIRPGDTVRVTATGDSVFDLRVVEIREESLTGDDLQRPSLEKQTTLQFSEIVQVEKKRINTAKTVGLSVGILAGVAAVLAILYRSLPCLTCE